MKYYDNYSFIARMLNVHSKFNRIQLLLGMLGIVSATNIGGKSSLNF